MIDDATIRIVSSAGAKETPRENYHANLFQTNSRTVGHPVLNLHRAFRDYEQGLIQAGYNNQVVRLHLRSIAHFGVWLELEGIALKSVNEPSVAAFDRHRSSCRCQVLHGRVADMLSAASAFSDLSAGAGMVNINAPPEPSHWSRVSRLDECAARRRRDNPHLLSVLRNRARRHSWQRSERTHPKICGTLSRSATDTTGAIRFGWFWQRYGCSCVTWRRKAAAVRT